MIPIPPKLRKEIDSDSQYDDCMLRALPGHVCGGRRNTREHAIMYQGKRLQEKWAIVSICARSHEVDEFQDAGTMNKEINVWLALNRATDAELLEISKAENYINTRARLNEKYGWHYQIPLTINDTEIKY